MCLPRMGAKGNCQSYIIYTVTISLLNCFVNQIILILYIGNSDALRERALMYLHLYKYKERDNCLM